MTETKIVPTWSARELIGGIGRTKLYELVAQGELKLVKIGRRSFITTKSINDYLGRITGY